MLKNLQLRIGTLSNSGLLKGFNQALKDNYGNLAPGQISQIYSKEVTISAADITQTTAGKLGHADGVTLVAAPGTGNFVELLSAVIIYDYDTAAYTDGGNLTVNMGSTALTGVASAANSLGASADKIALLEPLQAASTDLALNTGLSLRAQFAFTNPGTAAGTAKVHVHYRIHKA